MNKLPLAVCFLICISCNTVGATDSAISKYGFSGDTVEIVEREAWCKLVQSNILGQVNYSRTMKLAGKRLMPGAVVECCLVVDTSGAVSKLTVQVSSGIPKIDKKLLQLVRKAAPFRDPPAFYPFARNTIVKFEKQDDTMTCVVLVSRLMNGRIGEFSGKSETTKPFLSDTKSKQ